MSISCRHARRPAHPRNPHRARALLKDRRQVVRSLKDQLKQGFNVSVAELDQALVWQSATIGVVAISGSRDYLHGLIEEVERAARRMTNELGAELADSFWDYLEELMRLPAPLRTITRDRFKNGFCNRAQL